jgi:hypothetical protein
MSTSSQEPVPPADANADSTERTSLPRNASGSCRLAPSRAARLRAIHDLVRSNGYDVPAGLVAERMLEQATTGKREPQD